MVAHWLQPWFNTQGLLTTPLEHSLVRICNVIAYLVLVMLALQVPIAIYYWPFNGLDKLIIVAMHMIWVATCPMFNRMLLHEAARLSLILGFASYVMFSCVIWYDDLGTQYFFLLGLFVCPFLFLPSEDRQSWAFALAFAVLFLVFDCLIFPQAMASALYGQTWMFIPTSNSICMAVAALLTSHLIRVTVMKSWSRSVLREQDATRLLNKALPSDIAKQLRNQDHLVESHPCVSVLFCDIQGFSAFCQKTTPKELVSLLNRLYCRIDQLAFQYQLEKIKTNGDQYMVIAGAPNPRSQDTKRICEFALSLKLAFEAFCRLENLPLGLRVGIATGPAIAGIIGTQRVCYDIWGETVNLAARLESTGVEGKIQVCEHTFELIQHEFDLHYRAHIECKGIGKRPAYWLVRNKSTCTN